MKIDQELSNFAMQFKEFTKQQISQVFMCIISSWTKELYHNTNVSYRMFTTEVIQRK